MAKEDISHDCIELSVACQNCQHEMKVTMEFGPKGKYYRFGHYSRPRKILQIYSKQRDYNELRLLYKRMPERPFDLCAYNCKHWVSEFIERGNIGADR